MKHIFLLAILILAPSAFATHTDMSQPCRSSDCPLWARGGYTTPDSYSQQYDRKQTTYWYDDKPVRYVFRDVYHPPKHYYVHYNDNYRNYANQYHKYNNRHYNSYASRQIIHRGDSFTRYY